MRTQTIQAAVILLSSFSTAAYAATGSIAQNSGGLLVWLLIGFGVMVLLFQAAPAMVMFLSMLKGLFSSDPAEASFSPFKGKGRN